ncbi:hypothetical protein HAX54_042200 [Datura stramonium]|uniref:Uncharacterized protein n=1 Tax=Datura stramonium TaxID=4076 RepID=A0ABS8SM38_DATST|nr:hypothetical protein [Datura stramonium]
MISSPLPSGALSGYTDSKFSTASGEKELWILIIGPLCIGAEQCSTNSTWYIFPKPLGEAFLALFGDKSGSVLTMSGHTWIASKSVCCSAGEEATILPIGLEHNIQKNKGKVDYDNHIKAERPDQSPTSSGALNFWKDQSF